MRTFSCLCLSVLVGCTATFENAPVTDTSARDDAADIQAIKALEAAWDVANDSGDSAGIVALPTDDAIVMYANRPPLVGKEAVGSDQQAFFDQYTIENSKGVVEEVEIAGNWAYVRGTWTGRVIPKEGGDPWEETGKWIDICKRQPDGSWKIARNMYSSDHPVPTSTG